MWYIGIDIANLTFTASGTQAFQPPIYLGEFRNIPEGFESFLQHLPPGGDKIFLMEATGVYCEALAYFLYERRCTVCVEPPHKVKNAFYERGKSDPIDSRQIAEYGYRFQDQLHPWKPRADILEHLRVLLTTKEQYTRMMTSLKNARKAIAKKRHEPSSAIAIHTEMMVEFKKAGKKIEQEMKAIVRQNVVLLQHLQNLQTIKGVGFWIAINFLLATEGFTEHLHPKQLASYMGICPFPYESGTSVKHIPHADSAGPARLRKLLYLASMTMSKNNPEMRAYFERKVREGKPKMLVLNNLANKLLKIMCAIVQSGKPYDRSFQSVNPGLF